MTPLALGIGAVASIVLWLSGYLFGVRAGKSAREELRRELRTERDRARMLDRGPASSNDIAQLVKEAVRAARPEEVAPRFDTLKGSFKRRSELPALLTAIADEANLTALVLSDESGLPIAQAGSDRRTDTLSATSSVLLSFIDRLAASEMPHPVAAVVHDTEHQRLLYRVFEAGEDRFVLTAVSRGQRIEPDTLDAALGRIESLLIEALA